MILRCDTIAANDSVLAAFQQSRNYDYARDLKSSDEVNYFDRLWRYLEELFDIEDAGRYFFQSIPDWGWWCMCALVLAAAGFLVWKYQVKLFGPQDAELKAVEITEDDINELDFDQLIAEAENRGDYLTLCRLRYLQTLKAASDASLVTWKRYKTPTQYAMEWQDDDFGIMTNHFLRFRYGHYNADAALAREMLSLQETLQARIDNSAGKQEQTAPQQEGGEQS